MSIFRNFLLWLEEHQIGILTTIAVHLFIICAILVLKIKTNIDREYIITIEFSQIDFDRIEEISEDEEEENQGQQADNQDLLYDNYARNLPVNLAERAIENVERMIQEIKEEENIVDPPPYEDVPAETTTEEDDRIYDARFPENAAGERTIYRGPTTVSYELTGRRHTSMPIPVYRCRSGGTIVVNIIVDGNGYVRQTEINKSRSDSDDQCLWDAAKRDAERSRFDRSQTARQQGTITYVFQSQ